MNRRIMCGMPGQGRLGDKANVDADAHGCPGCPHPGTGPAINGSADVFVNGRPALRVDDIGIHAACCGPNMWQAQQGAPTVFINGKAAFRINDPSKHCGGQGRLIEGSGDVIVGDAASSGSSGGASNASASSSSQSAASASQSNASSSQSAASASQSTAPTSQTGAPASQSEASASGDATPTSERSFITIELVGEDGSPIPGERYQIIPPDGSVREGYLDDRGQVTLQGLDPGTCELTFPDLDRDGWEPL